MIREEQRRNAENRRQRDDYPEYLAQLRETSKRFHSAAREAALVRYSGVTPSCACCGVQHREFLAIDHIGGGGAAHRRSGVTNIYTWLKVNGYPDGFRVLCHNCNFAIRYGDPCPHEREKVVPFTRAPGGCS